MDSNAKNAEFQRAQKRSGPAIPNNFLIEAWLRILAGMGEKRQ